MLHFYSKIWRKSISNRASLQSGRPPRARPRRHAPGRLGRPPASPYEPPTRLPRPLTPSQRGSLLPHAVRVPRPSNATPPYVLPCPTPYEAARSSSPCPRCPLPCSCSHSTYLGATVPYPGVPAIPSGQPSCPPAPPRPAAASSRLRPTASQSNLSSTFPCIYTS
jgi:hypothetical protein